MTAAQLHPHAAQLHRGARRLLATVFDAALGHDLGGSGSVDLVDVQTGRLGLRRGFRPGLDRGGAGFTRLHFLEVIHVFHGSTVPIRAELHQPFCKARAAQLHLPRLKGQIFISDLTSRYIPAFNCQKDQDRPGAVVETPLTEARVLWFNVACQRPYNLPCKATSAVTAVRTRYPARPDIVQPAANKKCGTTRSGFGPASPWPPVKKALDEPWHIAASETLRRNSR